MKNTNPNSALSRILYPVQKKNKDLYEGYSISAGYGVIKNKYVPALNVMVIKGKFCVARSLSSPHQYECKNIKFDKRS